MVIRIMLVVLAFASMPGCAYWLHPSLHIYGKIVDQQGQPIPDVSVTHAVTRGDLIMGPMEGPASHIDTLITGRDGEFSVSTRGNGIFLERFEKVGYIFTRGSGQSCYQQYHVPEIAKCPDNMSEETPVIIPAWKKGEPTKLIERETTIHTAADEHVKRFQLEGVSIEMELQWKRSGTRSEPSDWSLTLSVIGGGIMENHDAFPYEAPMSGYQPQWIYDGRKGGRIGRRALTGSDSISLLRTENISVG